MEVSVDFLVAFSQELIKLKWAAAVACKFAKIIKEILNNSSSCMKTSEFPILIKLTKEPWLVLMGTKAHAGKCIINLSFIHL